MMNLSSGVLDVTVPYRPASTVSSEEKRCGAWSRKLSTASGEFQFMPLAARLILLLALCFPR